MFIEGAVRAGKSRDSGGGRLPGMPSHLLDTGMRAVVDAARTGHS
ncbi:hypothetical protein AB0N36_19035 [Streptomyces acidicola]